MVAVSILPHFWVEPTGVVGSLPVGKGKVVLGGGFGRSGTGGGLGG